MNEEHEYVKWVLWPRGRNWVFTWNLAYVHGNYAMSEFTSCLGIHLVNWYIEKSAAM